MQYEGGVDGPNGMRDGTMRRRLVQDITSAGAILLIGCLGLGSDDFGEPASEGFM